MVISRSDAINFIALSLVHKSLRTKALVLELLAGQSDTNSLTLVFGNLRRRLKMSDNIPRLRVLCCFSNLPGQRRTCHDLIGI